MWLFGRLFMDIIDYSIIVSVTVLAIGYILLLEIIDIATSIN